MTEKPKTTESPSTETEKVKEAKKVRERIDTLAVLGEFEKTSHLETQSNSSERQLLIEPGQLEQLPLEIRNIIVGYESFYAAMDDEEGEAYDKFLKERKNLQSVLPPKLYDEMLIIIAETSGEVYSFLEDRKANSWPQLVQRYESFEIFMRGWWFVQINEFVKPHESVQEMMVVAARACKENAQWFLDKAERDESGEMREEPPYILREAIGDEAFERVMEVAKETLGKSE